MIRNTPLIVALAALCASAVPDTQAGYSTGMTYNPYTGRTTQYQNNYNSYTGQGSSSHSSYNPYTGRSTSGSTNYNRYNNTYSHYGSGHNAYTGRSFYRRGYYRR